MTCLDDNQVLAFVERQLTDAEWLRLAEHLDACERCLSLTCAVAETMADTGPEPGVSAQLRSGELVGRYALIEMIGRGAMGGVYLALDPKLARKVALKVVRTARFAEPEIRARLSREARAMAQITHANVVAVYDAGELDDGVFIAMELVAGETLAEWTARTHRGWREIVRAYAAAGRGLAAAHAAGIVHRDFKPANVMVDRAGRVAVSDFGLALASAEVDPSDDGEAQSADLGDPMLTRTGALLGTPRYMSPEHFAHGEVDARSDQFSFAVSLYEALYATPPFRGNTLAELRTALAAPIAARPPESGIPVETHRVLVRALAHDPAKRWPSLTALVAALDHAARPRSRRWLVVGAAIAAAAAGGGLIAHRLGAHDGAPVVASGARIPIFVAPFTNQTGEPVLDDTLDAVVGNVIARSPGVDVTTSETSEGRDAIVVHGAVSKRGDLYDVTVDAADHRLAGGELHASAGGVARGELVKAATALAGQLRGALGDPETTLAHVALSSSLEAVHAYVDGQRIGLVGPPAKSAHQLLAALKLDPDFIEVHIALGNLLQNAGERGAAADELEKAVAGADRLGERARLSLLGDYDSVLGRFSEGIASYEQLLARWPGDRQTEISATAAALDAQSWPLALDLARRAMKSHPDLPVVRGNLLLAELANGHFDDAKRDGDTMLLEVPHPTGPALSALEVADVLLGKPADAHEVVARLALVQPALVPIVAADLAMYEGKLDDAEQVLRTYLAAHPITASRSHSLLLARLLARRGDVPGSLEAARQVVGARAVRLEYLAASLLVEGGDLATTADTIKAWTTSKQPEWRLYGHVLAGDAALQRHDAREALSEYQQAEQHGLSWIIHARKARAHTALGDAPAAAAELAWCQGHRGEIAIFLTPSLSFLPGLDELTR